jgi:hypothetical protein
MEPGAIYVYLCPPDSTTAIPLPLAGLSPFFRAVLAGLTRGSPVPDEVVAALIALAPRSALEP